MRCPTCNKFVSFEEGEPELDLDIDESGVITGTCRIMLACAECGEELKEANLDVEIDITDDLPVDLPAVTPTTTPTTAPEEGSDDGTDNGGDEEPEEDKQPEYELTDSYAEFTSRTETKDRHGKEIKSSRYMKTFYGAEVTATVKVTYPDGSEKTVEGKWSDDIQASDMDVLV